MTVWYDFTTTIRNTGRNGIANVEWSVGEQLLARKGDVRAFALDPRRRLVEIDPARELASVVYADSSTAPALQIDDGTWRDQLRRGLIARLGPYATPIILAMSRVYQLPRRARAWGARVHPRRSRPPQLRDLVNSGDVVVSLGADWEGNVGRELGKLRADTGCKVVTMVHDLIPLTHPHLAFANDPELFDRYYRTLLDVSDLIVCNSDQTRGDLTAFASERGRIAPRTEFLHLGDTSDSAGLERIQDRDDFFLWVGTIEARKNLEVLYDALRIIELAGGQLPRLVVAGATGWGVSDLVRELQLQSSAASRSTVLLGAVDVATLQGLYTRAKGLLFPSYYEGWGLPVREAAIRGCPVAAADCAAVRQALEGFDGATFLSPDDPAAWAEYMSTSPSSVAPLLPFTWAQTADQLTAFIAALP